MERTLLSLTHFFNPLKTLDAFDVGESSSAFILILFVIIKPRNLLYLFYFLIFYLFILAYVLQIDKL